MSVQIVTSNVVRHMEGFTRSLERGPTIRRENIIYEHVTRPIVIQRPLIEDFSTLVIVHNTVELYS